MYGRGDPCGRPVAVVGATLAVALDPALAANPQFSLEPFKMLSVFHQNKCHYFRHGMVQIDVTIFTQYTLLSPSGLFQQTGVHARTSRAFFLEEARVEHS